jgi:hypothetical protein
MLTVFPTGVDTDPPYTSPKQLIDQSLPEETRSTCDED